MFLTIPRTKKRISFGNAAVILMTTSLLAQVLGFLRTKLVNANFAAFPKESPQNAGVYFAAFTLPDFFFFTIAAGALGVAFMPYLSDKMHKGDRRGIWDLSSSLVNLLCLVMFAVGVLMFIFADQLVRVFIAHGLEPAQQHTVATMIRILSLNPLLFTISGVISAVEQVFGRFFFYAIAPLFYNLSIIASIFIFKSNVGIIGLAIGAAVGAVLQLIVIVVGTYGLGFRWKPTVSWNNTEFRSMVSQLPPRSLDQGLDQVLGIVETNIASNRQLGGATAIGNYNSAYVLHTAPILLIGTAISTAVFPRLNSKLSRGRPDLFRQDFLRVLRLIIWITLPVVVVSFFARGYLARLIFAKNSDEITIIFGFLCVAILFRTLFAIISRWYYAQKDTRTPLIVSVFVIGLNVVLAYTLSRPHAYGVAGLAIAQSIVAAVEVGILGVIMLLRDPKLFDRQFWSGIFQTLSVTGFSLVAGYLAVQAWPLTSTDKGVIALGSKLLAISIATLSTHIVVSGIFGLDEAKPIFAWLRRLILRPVKIDY